MEKSEKDMKKVQNESIKGEKTEKKSGKMKKKIRKLKAKALSAYYGNPANNLKLICITGTSGKSIVAHYVHEILRAANKSVAVLSSDESFKVAVLHKFLNDAYKAGAEYAVITTPAKSLEEDVFYGLPVFVAAMTDFIPATLDALKAEEYVNVESTLFTMNPAYVILNYDDMNYENFAKFKGTEATLTYGAGRGADVRIDSSRLYKKGAEANITVDKTHFTVATFLTGEPVVSYMAMVVAIGTALHIAPDVIADGIAEYVIE